MRFVEKPFDEDMEGRTLQNEKFLGINKVMLQESGLTSLLDLFDQLINVSFQWQQVDPEN